MNKRNLCFTSIPTRLCLQCRRLIIIRNRTRLRNSQLRSIRGTTVLFVSLRGYSHSWLPGDLIAAMTLAAIAIPEQLATARLAGMPPMAGLFAFAAGSLAFAAFGANRFISVGADSTIAPIMASALIVLAVPGAVQYANMAATLALLVGVFLVLAHIL